MYIGINAGYVNPNAFGRTVIVWREHVCLNVCMSMLCVMKCGQVLPLNAMKSGEDVANLAVLLQLNCIGIGVIFKLLNCQWLDN